MSIFQILDYSEDNLAIELSNKYTSKDRIKSKNQFKYFVEYFSSSGIKAKKILIESDYISKDYLSDYSSYYSLCFEKYEKRCKRLHFFNKDFSENEFKSFILSPKPNKEFWESYLGFIVVKPIPYTIIGISVLINYFNTDTIKRNFFGTRKYKIHIFGVKKIIHSLAFQEQDSVLAACATTAIWSMLQKASINYYCTLKSPNEITKDAGILSSYGNRLFPNKDGLSLEQMCLAIEKSGLVSEVRFGFRKNSNDSTVKNEYVKQLIFAYSGIGIPIIFVVKVPTKENPSALNPEDKIEYGYHAITISGYNIKDKILSNFDSTLHLNSGNLQKIYVHDDQWGPFSRIEFKDEEEIITNWTKELPSNPSTFIYSVVIPVYPKIRLSYDDIQSLVVGFNQIFFYNFNTILRYNMNWDIRLLYSETLKNEFRKSSLDDNFKIKYLKKSFPKYVWQAICYTGEEKIFEFIFDATDIANGMFGVSVISYNNILKSHLYENLSKNPGFSSFINHNSADKYLEFLLEELK